MKKTRLEASTAYSRLPNGVSAVMFGAGTAPLSAVPPFIVVQVLPSTETYTLP